MTSAYDVIRKVPKYFANNGRVEALREHYRTERCIIRFSSGIVAAGLSAAAVGFSQSDSNYDTGDILMNSGLLLSSTTAVSAAIGVFANDLRRKVKLSRLER
jgi:hypothetical protein